MASRSNFVIRDYSNELSNFGVTGVTLTEANFDAQLALYATLSGTVENLTIGHLDKYNVAVIPLDTPLTPTNVNAQRELKWLVQYMGDVSGKLFQIEIAAPDLTSNLVPNSDIANLASTDWAAFVAAFEAVARSPDNGTETVTVTAARLVGRNI